MANDKITRRQALKGIVGTALVAACEPVVRAEKPTPSDERGTMPSKLRMPVVFLPHGGGPWPFIDESAFGKSGMWDHMSSYMQSLSMVPPEKPEAILMVSAHWEEPVPTVMTAPRPPMLYDYYGFPPESYEVQWPAPGEPEIALKVRDRLASAGFATATNSGRGFDHGTFVPLKLAYPEADVPTFQLSLKAGLDPTEHFAMGRAIASLRDEGVFIVGSGMSYHNMRAFMRNMRGGATTIDDDSKAFDEWLAETATLDATQREARLVEWERAPRARACHPREEHLLPLMVVAGAAEGDAGSTPYRDHVMGAYVSAVHFG